MKTQPSKAREHTSRGIASEAAQRKRGPQPISQAAGSPSAIAQRKLQALANSGPAAEKRAAYQRLANQCQPVQRQQRASASRGRVVQRIAHNGAAVDIATLDLASAQAHLARLRRVQGLLKGNKAVPAADTAYTYDPADEAALQARKQALETAERTARHAALRDSLIHELAALATSADWEPSRPAWVGSGLKGRQDSEVMGANVPATLDAVRSQWLAFLGSGGLSQKHPGTGSPDLTRLVSADGQRSIRYGNHERTAPPNQHHFHQETWTHQPGSTEVVVANVLRRVPVS